MKIKVLKDVRGDFPFLGDAGVVKAGVYEVAPEKTPAMAYMNRNGAFSVMSDKDKLIGIMPWEYEFVSLADANEHHRIAAESKERIRKMCRAEAWNESRG